MHLKRKLPWILTGKALLATGSIAMVALALVTYTATVTISLSPFFKQGVTSTSWTFDVSTGTRYMPGNTALPGAPTATVASSFAFLTNVLSVGTVQINLATPVSTSDFQSFRIGVMMYNTSWVNSTLTMTATYPTTQIPLGLDGTVSTCSTASSCGVGFIHVNSAGPQTMFLILVTYVLTASPPDPSVTVNFQYTPNL